MISITNIYYILILVLSPLVLRNKYKKYIYLGLSLFVYYLGSSSLIAFFASMVYVLVPYFYCKLFKKKWPLLSLMVLLFVYLKRYDWIFVSLKIPYLIPFAIFGISYIVFRVVDYSVNYEFLPEDRKGIIDYLNYTLSFYTVLCGPIMGFSYFTEDFYQEKESLSRRDTLNCLSRMSSGFVKVLLFSHYLSEWAADNFAKLSDGFAFGPFLIFMVCNVWYIYFNFVGYCDIVISAGRLSGFSFPENFNKPYFATDISDFWNRQHITLSKWITNYVFTSTVKSLLKHFSMDAAQYIGFFIAFLIAGLWHGTNLNYLAYGILQAAGVCLTKLYTSCMTKKLGGKKQLREYRKKPVVHVLEILVTQCYIYISFIFIGYDVIGLIF